MSIATIPQAISRGDLSTSLAVIDNERGALFGPRISAPASPRTILMVTDALRWGYNDGDSPYTDASNREVANYLIWLCGKYGREAEFILDNTTGGGSVSPSGGNTDNGLFPLVITDADMTDGTIYDNPKIVGKNIMLWVSHYSQEWEVAPDFFIYTATGFQIVRAGFDAAKYAFIRIDKFNSPDSSASTNVKLNPIEIDYDLVADATLITNPTNITTQGQLVIVTIKPNGFTYTWDTMFEFSSTYPEQPTAISASTIQIYTFAYITATGKLDIVSESLDISI